MRTKFTPEGTNSFLLEQISQDKDKSNIFDKVASHKSVAIPIKINMYFVYLADPGGMIAAGAIAMTNKNNRELEKERREIEEERKQLSEERRMFSEERDGFGDERKKWLDEINRLQILIGEKEMVTVKDDNTLNPTALRMAKTH